MWSNVKNKVSDFIGKHQLLSRDSLHIVALSGGADSVALLHILSDLGYRIEAAHCNFHLRGEESNRDEQFVKELCEKSNIPLHLIHFDTEEYASLHQVSIEMAARDLRYRYFSQLCQDIGAASVCVAHHRDDVVETLLMNLLRGSGIHGLTGIRPQNGLVVRPLLCLSRQEIEDYLHSIGQAYVIDSTNLTDDVLRNKIRHHVIPLLNGMNPKAIENIAKTTGYLQEAEKIYNQAIREQLEELVTNDKTSETQTVSLVRLTELPSPLAFLHEWLSPFGFNSTQIQQTYTCLGGQSGKEFRSPTHSLLVDRDVVAVEPSNEPMKTMKMPEHGRYVYMDDMYFDIETTKDISVSKSTDCATLDAEKVQFPLTVRPVCTGDVFVPFGMDGHKLVSDYLTDRKCTLFEKRRQLVVTDCHDQIIWLVGQRTDNRYRVTEQTTSVLRITLK